MQIQFNDFHRKQRGPPPKNTNHNKFLKTKLFEAVTKVCKISFNF
jgi:hypothetical protein